MTSIDDRYELVRKVEDSLRRFGVRSATRLIVAVSGGADSTALLCSLIDSTRLKTEITAVHVVHGLRARAEHERDVSFLESLCSELGVELRVRRIEEGRIREIASTENRSTEEVARELRYEMIEKAAENGGAEWIAVAHTMDDQLETLLMRLLQGGHLQGMSGIPEQRRKIIRPLLGCTRQEVLDYLAGRGVDYRVDETNSDERYLRNRVRRRLIPVVRSIFPSAVKAAATFTNQAAQINGILDTCAALLLPWAPGAKGYAVSAESFFRAPAEIRVRSVLMLFNQIGAARRIPKGFLRPLESPVRRRSGGRILEGHGAVVEHRGDTVFLYPDIVLETKRSYLIHVFEPSTYNITPTLCFTVSTVPKGSAGARGIFLPESLIRHPLVVRSRRPGDTIQMKEGTKSLKKLFNEWCVPESFRERLPVIEDRTGVWAVGGEAFGYRNRVRYYSGLSVQKDVPGKEIVFAFEYRGDQP